jgi:hypothetical protein
VTPCLPPSLEEQIAIVRGLLALRRSGRLPAIWIDQGRIAIEAGYGCRQRITWRQAARLAAGEPSDEVCVFEPTAREKILRVHQDSRTSLQQYQQLRRRTSGRSDTGKTPVTARLTAAVRVA